MGAHHAGDRVAVAEPDAVKTDMGGLQHQLLGVRSPAQEREVGGDGEFEIAEHSRIHPVQEPARHPTGHAPCRDRGLRETARSADRLCPRCGNNRARAAALLAPPGACDALGAVDRDHFMQGAPPAEAHRRAVGHQGENVIDRLRLGEQPQRSRAQGGLGVEAAKRLPAGLGFCLRRHHAAASSGMWLSWAKDA